MRNCEQKLGVTMKKILLIIFLVLFTSFILAENVTYRISGKVYFTHQKPIYIFLVDEETSKKPLVGIDTLIIIPSLQDSSNTQYTFNNVKEGKYGVRCFQDLNGNGKLDRGLFGPSEPWGLSWNESKTSNWPSFKNFCFDISNDKINVDIRLKD